MRSILHVWTTVCLPFKEVIQWLVGCVCTSQLWFTVVVISLVTLCPCGV